ncbi:hypothetical protein ABFS83_10G098300 [Erythranthe nasuta]
MPCFVPLNAYLEHLWIYKSKGASLEYLDQFRRERKVSLIPCLVSTRLQQFGLNSIYVTLGRRGNPPDFGAPTPNYEGYLNLNIMKLQPRFLELFSRKMVVVFVEG